MKSRDTRLLRLIAFFKLLNAALLIAVGVSAFELVHSDITGVLTDWVIRLGLDPGGRHVGRFLLQAAMLTPSKIRDLAVGSMVYAGLFVTEGIGLWFLKRWAEWLTIVITGSLIPVEIYEIYRHPTPARILLLILNIAVVAYLVYRIRAKNAH